MNTPASIEPKDHAPHSLLEDLIALVLGTSVIAFGVVLLQQSHAITGGTSGLAFLLHYLTGMRFGVAFFLLNLPFYYLGYKRMGAVFVVKTFSAVALLSVLVEFYPHVIEISQLNPLFAALFGNILMGLGFIVLFRHRASLGGINILALYLQAHHGLRAGKFQMGVDVLIVLASLVVVPLSAVLASVAGAVLLNLIIAMNHRPGRYLS